MRRLVHLVLSPILFEMRITSKYIYENDDDDDDDDTVIVQICGYKV